jgi:serine/threonine-protein kinase
MAPPTEMAPHLGPLFDMWFAKACSREPEQRFGSARDMIDELGKALGVDPSTGITTGSGPVQINVPAQTAMQTPPGMVMGPQTPPGMYMPAPVSGPGFGPVSGPGFAPVSGPGFGPVSAPGMLAPPSGPAPSIIPTAASFDGSHPVYSTPSRKSQSATAALLGVVIALIVGASAVGIYLTLPSRHASHADSEPPAAQASDSDSEDSEDETDDEPVASAAPKETPPEVKRPSPALPAAKPSPAPSASAKTPVASSNIPPTAVAPKVDNVTF